MRPVGPRAQVTGRGGRRGETARFPGGLCSANVPEARDQARRLSRHAQALLARVPDPSHQPKVVATPGLALLQVTTFHPPSPGPTTSLNHSSQHLKPRQTNEEPLVLQSPAACQPSGPVPLGHCRPPASQRPSASGCPRPSALTCSLSGLRPSTALFTNTTQPDLNLHRARPHT